jgi:DNA-binding protein H-NS
MPERRAKDLLDRWRELERQLENAQRDQRASLWTEIERVKREYSDVVELIAQGNASDPEGRAP